MYHRLNCVLPRHIGPLRAPHCCFLVLCGPMWRGTVCLPGAAHLASVGCPGEAHFTLFTEHCSGSHGPRATGPGPPSACTLLCSGQGISVIYISIYIIQKFNNYN